MCCPLTLSLICLCSIPSERPEARQHSAAPWHHPHQGNPDSGLRICGECTHTRGRALWTACRGLKLVWGCEEKRWFQRARGSPLHCVCVCFYFDWFDPRVSSLTEFHFFNAQPTETWAVDILIGILWFIGHSENVKAALAFSTLRSVP